MSLINRGVDCFTLWLKEAEFTTEKELREIQITEIIQDEVQQRSENVIMF